MIDSAEKEADARAHDSWDTREISRLVKELEAQRIEAVDQLKATVYFERQADWLLSRFPDAEFTLRHLAGSLIFFDLAVSGVVPVRGVAEKDNGEHGHAVFGGGFMRVGTEVVGG